jgi:putative copper resistance protein D
VQFPISRQGLQDIANVLIAGMAIFALLAFFTRRRGGDFQRQLRVVGILGVLVVVCYALAFTVAPNIPTPAVPFTARFMQNPVPDDAAAVDTGRATFQANCAICHGSRALGDGPQAFVLNPRPVNLQVHVPQHAAGELFYWISEGVAGTQMPSWKDKLTEEQRWQVIRFLQALASGKVQQ